MRPSEIFSLTLKKFCYIFKERNQQNDNIWPSSGSFMDNEKEDPGIGRF